MKRSFLKELGLDSEVIDKIMTENGKDIEKYKTDIEDYVSEIKELKSKNVDNLKAIDEVIKVKEKELRKELEKKEEEHKEALDKANKYDSVFKELEDLKKANSDKEYTSNIEKFFKENKINFTSSFAKEAIIGKFKEKEFKLNEDKFGDDAISFVKELQESNKDAFKDVKEQPNNPQPYTYTPNGGGDGSSDLASQVNAMLGL